MRRAPAVLLFVVASALSVALLEGLFRLYESRRLIREVRVDGPVYDLTQYDYNDHGERIARTREPGEFRVLSFGDSFAQSITKAPYTYAAVLQQRLEDAAGRPVRVVNLGQGLTSLPEYLSQLRIWGSKLEHDAVLFNIYAGNDFQEASAAFYLRDQPDRFRPDAEAETFRRGPGVEIPRRYPLRTLDYVRALWLSRTHTVAESERYHFGLQPPMASYVTGQRRTAAAYRRDHFASLEDGRGWLYKLVVTARKLEEAGTLVALTVAPPHFVVSEDLRRRVLEDGDIDSEAIDAALPGSVVRDFAARAGVEGPVLDLTACLRAAAADGEALYHGTNTHWDVRGNALVGDALARELGPRWLGSEPGPLDPVLDRCGLEVPPSPGPLSDLVAASFETSDDIARFEETALAPLLERRFATRAALFEALEGLGYRAAAQEIRGELLGFLPSRKDGTSRPHGWAFDGEAPEDPVFVAVVHRGRVVSVCRTRTISPVLAERRGIGDGTPKPAFTARVRASRGRLEADGFWAVVLTPRGTFRALDGPEG